MAKREPTWVEHLMHLLTGTVSEPVPCCEKCDEPATWVRRTQFNGDFYFCSVHAAEQKDFGKEDSSYFVWRGLPLEPSRRMITMDEPGSKPAVFNYL